MADHDNTRPRRQRPAWHRTPGAIAWLTTLAATLAPKRRTRATMH